VHPLADKSVGSGELADHVLAWRPAGSRGALSETRARRVRALAERGERAEMGGDRAGCAGRKRAAYGRAAFHARRNLSRARKPPPHPSAHPAIACDDGWLVGRIELAPSLYRAAREGAWACPRHLGAAHGPHLQYRRHPRLSHIGLRSRWDGQAEIPIYDL